MTWSDGSRWDAAKGRRLAELMVESYPSEDHMRALVGDLKMGAGVMPPRAQLGLMWYELVGTVHTAGKLRRAAELLAQTRPAVAAEIAELLADPPAQGGNPADQYQVRILDGGLPMIGRMELRRTLREFLENTIPALVVIGDSRTGKSYSFRLLLHVTSGRDDLDVVQVDFSSASSGDDAQALMTKLRRRLGLPAPEGSNDPTTRLRSTAGLVEDLIDELVGAYRRGDGKRRIIVIDGLNRPDLREDVHQLAGMLITEVVNRQLPGTQIVLTGFAGGVDPAHGELIAEEHVTVITGAHVQTFFQGIVEALGKKPELVTTLVAEAAVGQGDLEALNLRVRSAIARLRQPVQAGDRS